MLGLYLIVLAMAVYVRREDWRRLRGRHLTFFLFLALLTLPLNNLLWVRFSTSEILTPPGLPQQAPPPSFPLLGNLTIFLTGALFGAGPAALVGLLAGLARAFLDSSRVLQPTELAVVGLALGILLRQDYRGLSGRIMRLPLVAGLIVGVLNWVLLVPGIFVATIGSRLSALDYTWSLSAASIPAVLLGHLLAGGVLQLVYLLLPGLKPDCPGLVTPPHERSMNQRLLTLLIPSVVVLVVVLFYTITSTTMQEAVRQAVREMTRDAHNASEVIPLYFQTGFGLLERFAQDERLQSPDYEVRQSELDLNLRTGIYGPFFDQLILFDGAKEPINCYPDQDCSVQLEKEEREAVHRTVNHGSSQHTSVFQTNGSDYVMSFVVAVGYEEQAGGGATPPQGALLGRTYLNDKNPMIKTLLANLQWKGEAGAGFIIDQDERIVVHPDPDNLLTEWPIYYDRPDISGLPNTDKLGVSSRGKAYEDQAFDGTRRLVYYLPVEGTDWTIVITYPYDAVLDLATRISRPVLIILVLMSGVLVVSIPWVTGRLTRPLKTLSVAAGRIAKGELASQVQVSGDDEVGQLGRSFEQMRRSLKARLEDLSLLLQVSQAVSASLDLAQGAPAILEGALQATDAHFVRLILLDERGDPQLVMARGQEGPVRGVTALDRAMARLGQSEQPVTIEDISQAHGLIEPSLAGPDVRAAMAVPLRSKDMIQGVLWLAYKQVHPFNDAELNFLSTLASQAAVAVENARLFQAAEGGRRRLEAILASTKDVVIVTDHANRILLINPAAAQTFDCDSRATSGKPIDQVVDEKKVVRLLTRPMDGEAALTEEIPLDDGRTLYAIASEIISGDGQAIGRVAVLRDITYLKELDEMKSEFVATVSHDLRAPLTFMRGYATMIPMVGNISPKQQTFVDKIMVGIEQMTELIDDLLDLGRIEAGVGLIKEPCRLGDVIVMVVDSMRVQATAKGLSLQLEPLKESPAIVGDVALLRHAISNLLENAIKYTPEGGTISVGLETVGDRAILHVRDTGIGIAKADQERLFEKFYRVKRRDTIDIKGSGLGLAIVKSIAERHNGRVWVESELAKGSTFYIELPIKQPAEA